MEAQESRFLQAFWVILIQAKQGYALRNTGTKGYNKYNSNIITICFVFYARHCALIYSALAITHDMILNDIFPLL